jgi:hypothetical protein
MEGLPDFSNFITNFSKIFTPIAGLAGTGANIYSGIQNMQQAKQQAAAQQYVANLTQNPQKMAAAAAQYTQPLSAGLTSGIGNLVQGQLAERGLGSSPAAYTQALTQAIAPYLQQNQAVGLQALMNQLGLASGVKATQFPMMDVSKALAAMKFDPNMFNPNATVTPNLLNVGGPDPLGLNQPAPVNMPSSDEFSNLWDILGSTNPPADVAGIPGDVGYLPVTESGS